MVNKAQCYEQALQEVRNHRHIALEKADRARFELLAKHPELREVENDLLSLIKRSMAVPSDSDSQWQNELSRLHQKRSYILTELGYSADIFEPAFYCSACDDSGMCDGGFCQCVKRIAHKKMLAQLCEELPSDTFTFDTFSLKYYDNEVDRDKMETIYQTCVQYADTFSNESDSLYMLGKTGLGKTHLTFAMAKEIVAKGFSVIYCSAQNMITELENEHFGHSDFKVSEFYCKSDLLIIDDLGTEYLSPIAQSALYNVVNQRILLKRPTIVNSNLTPIELEHRYGERLVSRIFGCYRTLRFVGKDIRIQKRLASKKL